MSSAPVIEPVRPPRRLSPRVRRRLDRALVVGLLLPVVAVAVSGSPPVWALLSALQILPLWWRREWPVAVFTAVAVASALQLPVTEQPLWGQLAFPIATYSVARYGSATAGWATLAVSLVAAVAAARDWVIAFTSPLTASALVPYVVTIAAIVVTAWTLGTLGRVRAAYVDGLLERNQRIEREAAQQVALAATEERTRIARELHDVVAHSLSVIIVQADGARYAALSDPTADPRITTTTLGTISRTGREALSDMRRMLGLLRSGDTGTAPVPDLASLPGLVETAGARHRLVGVDRDVPGAVALTTYRLVQEALTNVRKHAGPDADPSVSVTVGSDVAVEVRDRGRGGAAAAQGADGPGHGLVGMRERVQAHGGELSAGPAPGGGFLVSARIPL